MSRFPVIRGGIDSASSNSVFAPEIERILATFNTWSFKREQPHDLPLMRETLFRCVQAKKPIDFTLYWGKGPRSHFAGPERECFAFLSSMAERIKVQHVPCAHFDVIFTDTHARLNGYNEREIQYYFDALRSAPRHFRADFHLLSAVVERADTALTAWASADPELLERLEASAEKWFSGEGSYLDAAARYYDMNMIERKAVETVFPDSIFITFNGSEFRQLFPDRLPIFYMYSVRRGTSVKPWFLADESDGDDIRLGQTGSVER